MHMKLDYKLYEKSKYKCPLCGNFLLPSTLYGVFIGKSNQESLWCYFCNIKSDWCKDQRIAYKNLLCCTQLSLFGVDDM